MATITKTLTSEQAAAVESYIKQGFDKETAIRVATAKGRKPSTSKGNLGYNKGFSLL